MTFSQGPTHKLAGELGFTAILNTWDQKVNSHCHIHCVIHAGVWNAEQKQWISTPYKFLFPVQAVSKVFRGKFLDYLKQANRNGKLSFHGQMKHLSKQSGFAGLLLGNRSAAPGKYGFLITVLNKKKINLVPRFNIYGV